MNVVMIAMLMMMWNMTMTVLMMIATTETRMLNKRENDDGRQRSK